MSNNNNKFKYIDHTLLKAFATWNDISTLCDEAIKYNMASVCIPASYVKQVKKTYSEKINICTVIGFPLGYSTTRTKVFETKEAILDGASEIDMVINICDVKNGDLKKVKEEILAVRNASKGKILKVIIETCYLTNKEKINLCNIITESKVDFIKTSTGFGSSGANHEDIKLFSKNISKNVKIKAAGGIKTKKDLLQYLDEGCSRIGTSSAIEILKEI